METGRGADTNLHPLSKPRTTDRSPLCVPDLAAEAAMRAR